MKSFGLDYSEDSISILKALSLSDKKADCVYNQGQESLRDVMGNPKINP